MGTEEAVRAAEASEPTGRIDGRGELEDWQALEEIHRIVNDSDNGDVWAEIAKILERTGFEIRHPT